MATSFITKPRENLRDLIASSATFQAWVGAGDAEAAKAYINLTADLDPENSTRPRVIINEPEDDALTLEHAGAPNHQLASGTLLALFVNDLDAEETIPDEKDSQDNTVGKILGEMLADTNYAFEIQSIGPSQVSHEDNHPDQTRWIDTLLTFTYSRSPIT